MKKLLLLLSICAIACKKEITPTPQPEKKPYHLLDNCVNFKPDTVWTADGKYTIPRWICTQWKTDTVWDN
jgi:hypothetical protein